MKTALISFSNNYDMQEYLYSMQSAGLDMISIGSDKVIVNRSLKLKENFLVKCPNRPTIERDTFKFSGLKQVRKILINNDINNIVFLSSHTWNLLLGLILPNAVKKYHIIHDVIPHEKEKVSFFIGIYNKICILLMDYIIVHSNGSISLLQKRYSISNDKIDYLPLWYRTLDFMPYRDTRTCLFFGRINPYKGVDTILYLAEMNPNLNFNIVGKVSNEMEYIIPQLEALPNINLINCYVTQQEIDKNLYNADIVLLPYKTATQSGVVLEAYNHSRPVIAYNVGNLTEQIVDNVSGFLVKENNLAEFNEKLEKYFSMTIQQKNMFCSNAWNFGKNHFDVNLVSRKLEEILN